MPSRYVSREALPDGIYHVFNRGVERRRIFLASHDYRRFKLQIENALAREASVEVLAYSLMSNHFHLLLRQSDTDGVARFMQRLITAYVMYFNRRNGRVGPLLEGRYKAVRIVGPAQLMDVSRYIHLNPFKAHLTWRQEQHSSLPQYLTAGDSSGFVNPWPVLELFDQPGDYLHFLSIRKVRP